MNEEWPFDQPPDCAVITLKSILSSEQPILYASHDAEDHGWQFLDGGTPDVENATVAALSTILEFEPSLWDLANLPPGWYAFRESAEHAWVRAPESLTVV